MVNMEWTSERPLARLVQWKPEQNLQVGSSQQLLCAAEVGKFVMESKPLTLVPPHS
jgi:hypothetical protein